MLTSCLHVVILVLYCSSIVQSYDSMTPKRNNEVYYWEQSPGVAKYVERKYPSSERNSSRRLQGRHVCIQSKVVMVPMKETQSYCKPVYQSYLRRCDKNGSTYCTGYRVVYELAYRHVQMLVPKTESHFACCPGWRQSHASATDCKKALCNPACKNGGICTKPDHCACPPGWTGKTCETDVDECAKRKHGCEHKCVNLLGSYKCTCKESFQLAEDKRSCTEMQSINEINDEKQLNRKMEELQQRLAALEEWQRRIATDGPESRHQRDDRINSLSEQMAIMEETLEECSCYRRNSLPVPPPQK